MSEPHMEVLSRLWEEHVRAPFPAHLRGREIAGEDLVMLDADVAGCVLSAFSTPLGEGRRAVLLRCLAATDMVLRSLDDHGAEIEYYQRLRGLAALAAGQEPDGTRSRRDWHQHRVENRSGRLTG